MNDPVIVALTPNGLALARRLVAALGQGEAVSAKGSARQVLQDCFQAGRPLICVMALGIVVRILGPLATDKLTDSAVVVVDEAGRFAISVLGGHAAGANALAERVAKAIGAEPVITTASDVLGLPAVDLIGQDWGWKIEGKEDLTTLAAAVVKGERVGVWQDAGRRDWWKPFGEWPSTFEELDGLPHATDWTMPVLAISDRAFPVAAETRMVIYRPPTLVLGVGCRRGVPAAEIDAMFQQVCRTEGFSPLSLGVVATANLKADEPGLQKFAAQHGVPLRSFSLEELARVAPLPTPSETVRSKIGILGVAEPAAMLAAGTATLLVPKQCGRRVTMALARRENA